MEHFINSILPDSLTGAILAIEGIRDAAVVLNGPTGCKLYHGAVVDGQFPREVSLDALNYLEEFYFGQPRVPATYLDGHDYVYGSAAKLERIMPVVTSRGHSLIAVVNSPGAALIGDELKRFIAGTSSPIPCIALESTGFSGTITDGFQQAVRAVVEELSPPPAAVVDKGVNLIGISIYHKHWEGSIGELHRLLNLCGIKVVSTVCAGTTMTEIKNLSSARCNVVIYPEYADILVPWLEERFGIPGVLPEEGAPLGFDAVEGWITRVAEAVDVDPAPARAVISDARRRSFLLLERFNALTGLPKGATFAIYADPSTAYALTKWLYSYLGMMPVAVVTNPTGSRAMEENLASYLAEIDCFSSWQVQLDRVSPDIVLADGNTIAALKGRGLPAAGVEIALPSVGYMDVVPKALLGVQGTLFLLEQIINGLYSGVL